MAHDLSFAVRSDEQAVNVLAKPKKPRFTHLHLHTPGSLLDGFCRIDELVDLAIEYGMDAVGVSEHGNCNSHIEFYKACKDKGIKPILGMEGYITPFRTWKKPEFNAVVYTRDTFAYRTKKELKSDGAEAIENTFPEIQSAILHDMIESRIHEEFPDLDLALGEELSAIEELRQAMTQDLLAQITSDTLVFSAKPDDRIARHFSWRPKVAHLLMIAKNNEGYSNLLKITSVANLEGMYYKPRCDYDLIKKYGKGIIATSACLGGEIPQLIRAGKERVAKNLARFYQKCFDEFYFELQPSNIPEQIELNEVLKRWSVEMDIPLVATSDAHMLRPEELPIHKALTMIGKAEDDSDISVYEHCFFKNVDEMLEGGMPPEALENAYHISQICNVELELGGIKLPKFPVPQGYDPDSYLKKLTHDAFFDLMLSEDIDIPEYQARLEEELSVIFSKKFSPYFLIVWDYIKFARENGILVGPGRGSAGGSLVAYLLRITNIDPIKYDLLFERFLDPSRKDMPDVDSDSIAA